MAAVGLLLNPRVSCSQSNVSYVSYESCELCKKNKPGADGDAQSEIGTVERFGCRGSVAGSSSAVVTSPWRWQSKAHCKNCSAHPRTSTRIGSARSIGSREAVVRRRSSCSRGNDSCDALQALQRQGQGGGKSQAQPSNHLGGWTAQRQGQRQGKAVAKRQAQPCIQQQGCTAQRSYYKEAKQQRLSCSLEQKESRR